MSFLTILKNLIIGPLMLVFEIIFSLANKFVGHPGLAIIFLSLIMNILVLPLYRRADAMQEAARDIDLKLRKGVAHIKKTFSGDEQMMILQTYYRQNNYKPTDALNGSVSLLLEIPFFIAAYQFLSHLEILKGVPFGPIADLGAPDGLLKIGGLAINLLPILMTLINVISSAIYLKGFPLKTKIQLYGMAAFFLVFLYTSPSCLVFYWTLNNLFSLVKTIFYKLKNPKKVLYWLLAILGTVVLVYAVGFYSMSSSKLRVALILLAVVCIIPQALSYVDLSRFKLSKKAPVSNPKMFLWGSIFLTVLVGLVIPTTYIAASPQEFVDVKYFAHPLWYVVSTASMAAGTFLVWMRVFYWLADTKVKVLFERLVWIMCGLAMVNYVCFGTNLGVISAELQYETGMYFSTGEQLINLLIMAAVAAVLYFIAVKWNKAITAVLLAASIGLTALSGVNTVSIKKSVDNINMDQNAVMPQANLSKSGKNVIVIMLDRALGTMLPYVLNEKPELKETFAGFTYYDNTISYGMYTNFCTPALFGGYEYTPVELNKRSDELLVDKHNEALKLLPVLFNDNGYNVTVCDPVYANYEWIADLSIFDEYPGIKTYNTDGAFEDVGAKQARVARVHRNFFCFSVMKCMPELIQTIIYNDGVYNQISTPDDDYSSYTDNTAQTTSSLSTSEGVKTAFMRAYNVLENLPQITKITNENTNTYFSIVNNTTHEPMLLQAPEYVPASSVDNTQYDLSHMDRFTVNGVSLNVSSQEQMIHYHANMAALLRIGEWLDYLRENGVYDNTRIILVSDHGRALKHIDQLVLDPSFDVEGYFPLLMVKDFDSKEFTVSHEFMTNADVPTLALQGLIENPVNPFTHKPITNEEKFAHDQYIILSNVWNTHKNDGNTFLPSKWASVKDNIWDLDNWSFSNEATVLQEHELP